MSFFLQSGVSLALIRNLLKQKVLREDLSQMLLPSVLFSLTVNISPLILIIVNVAEYFSRDF